jgi:NADH-quinone oxidoreductase subunit A
MFFNEYNLINDFKDLFIYFFFSILLCFVIIVFCLKLSKKKSDVEKLSTYECGFDPYDDARKVFDVRFYLAALIFLIFDLEVLFLFPWSVSNSTNHDLSFLFFVDFFFELILGYLYAWKLNTFNWD